MKLHTIFTAAGLAAAALATPATAANFIKNGSFEAGPAGNGAVPEWTRTNTPDGVPTQDQKGSIITYNSAAQYPLGAYGEKVTPDSAVSASPDAVGTKAAYFVGDYSVNETWSQMTYLGVGNYKVGFSYYLTQNGLNNINNASLSTTILGTPVATTMITGGSAAKTWFYASGVAQITTTGHYLTSLVFNSNGFPSKDVVVDRVFGVRTTEDATVVIPPGPSAIPEPETWALMLLGFGMLGVSMRRRQSVVTA